MPPRDSDHITPFEPDIYAEFVRRARALLAHRQNHHDPGTLSLVDDVLADVLRGERDGNLPPFDSDEDLLRYLSRCMRNHLVSVARRRMASRRPPVDRRVEWPETEMFPATRRDPSEIIDIHDALTQLSERNERLGQTVELIFFGGCTQREVAEILGRSVDQVRADWAFARSWLRRKLR